LIHFQQAGTLEPSETGRLFKLLAALLLCGYG
jgi:hypothetical protein